MSSKYHNTMIQNLAKGMGLGMFSGAERIADLAKTVQAPERSDLATLRTDWMRIGGDFRGAIKQLQTETSKHR